MPGPREQSRTPPPTTPAGFCAACLTLLFCPVYSSGCIAGCIESLNHALALPLLDGTGVEPELGEDRLAVLAERRNGGHDWIEAVHANRWHEGRNEPDRRVDPAPRVTARQLRVVDELGDRVDARIGDLCGFEARDRFCGRQCA